MQEIEKNTFVITICSGKGGVGKSVITANLANLLSESGYSVLIWDANINFPNQHLINGVELVFNISDVYQNKTTINQAIHSIKNNLDLIADKPATGILPVYDSNSILNTYESILLNTNYDIVIIDTPAGGSNDVLQCCNIADIVQIVVTDEPTSILDAYGLLKLILPIVPKDYINLLVNNVIDFEDADEITFKLNLATEKFLKVKLDVTGFVPYDRIIRQSILQQDLFVNANPDSEPTLALKKIAKNLLAKINLGIKV
jgi:flagellar biosynthesis protein FlhG